MSPSVANTVRERRIVWNKRARSFILPSRQDPPVARPPLSQVQALRVLTEPFTGPYSEAGLWRKGISRSAAADRAMHVIDGRETDGSPALEGVRGAMLGIEGRGFRQEGQSGSMYTGEFAFGGGPDRAHALLSHWTEIGGLVFCCEALRVTQTFDLACSASGPRDDQGMWLTPRKGVDCLPPWPDVWMQLRERVALAEEREVEEVEAWIEARRPALELSDRVRWSFVCPQRPDWSEADARAIPAAEPAWYPSWTLPGIRDPHLAAQLAEVTMPESRVLHTVLANLGVDAFEFLARMRAPAARGDQRARLQAMTLIETPEAVEFLLNFLGTSSTADLVGRYLRRVPEWSIPALEAATKSGSNAARLMLDALTRYLKLDSDRTPDDQDKGEGLPPVLLVPFGTKKSATKPPAFAPPFPTLRSRVVALDVTREVEVDSGRAAYLDHPDAIADRLRQEALKPEQMDVFEPRVLVFLPADEALELWRNLPNRFWRIKRIEALEGLIDRFDLAALPKMIECMALSPVPTMVALQGVFAAELAAPMASLLVSSATARPLALEWLARFANEATLALVPDLIGCRGAKEQANAAVAVSSLMRNGHAQAVEAAFNLQTSFVKAMAVEGLSTDPFLVPGRRPGMLPPFWTPRAWPPLRTSAGRTPPDYCVDNLGHVLSVVPLGLTSPAIASVKSVIEADTLSAFGKAVFDSWMAAGAPPGEVWALHAVGHLCGDEMVEELVRHVHDWPVSGRPGYAATGLAVLAQVGTQEALLAIHRVSQRFKSKGLKERAGRVLADAAAARGMSREELADRLVPEFGLDHRSRRSISFGARRFHIGLTSKLQPVVMSEEGLPLKQLPPARKEDDIAAVEEAHALWKRVKREARAVLTHERRRLEAAMLAERRWSIADFEKYLVKHPLLGAIARTLVWAAHGPDSKDAHLFRVSDSQGPVDISSAPVHFDDALRVGLPHPITLADEDRRAWRQHFDAWGLSQAFEQLERPVHLLPEDAATAFALDAFRDVEVQSPRVLGLEDRGWRRSGEQSGSWAAMIWPIPNSRWQAEFTLTPGIFAMVTELPVQTLGPLMIGPRCRDSWGTPREPVPLGALSRVAYSEIVHALSWLTEGRASPVV